MTSKHNTGDMKKIKLSQSNYELVNEITDKIWGEIAQLKGQIETKDMSAAPYHVTTSIYLTGNQIVLGLTKERIKEMVKSWFYQAIHIEKIEEKSLERHQHRLIRKEEQLDYRLKEATTRSLKTQIKLLEDELAVWREAADKLGYVIE